MTAYARARESAPAPGSRTANSSNDPTNQEVINSLRETPIHRS
jgi:hypothetical protein